MAQDIEKAREGSRVLSLIVDVRNGKDMAAAAERCKAELVSISSCKHIKHHRLMKLTARTVLEQQVIFRRP